MPGEYSDGIGLGEGLPNSRGYVLQVHVLINIVLISLLKGENRTPSRCLRKIVSTVLILGILGRAKKSLLRVLRVIAKIPHLLIYELFVYNILADGAVDREFL